MIIRTVILAFALFNQLLVMNGVSTLPFTEEGLELFLTGAFTVVASLIAWYKNNSVTKEAKQADEYLEELRIQKKIG